jgi:hypothetical protein
MTVSRRDEAASDEIHELLGLLRRHLAEAAPGAPAAKAGSHEDAPGEEATWPAACAVVAALLLQLVLPANLVLGPTWVLPVLEAVLLVPLLIGVRRRHPQESLWARVLSIGLVAVINVANVASLTLLAYYLIHGGRTNGHQLILASISIWLTNVLIFGLWYWELDRGGPGVRLHPRRPPPEFLFPQMANPDVVPGSWRPNFVDYLYVSLTNATAFSPTDTMPLSRRIKALMGLQAVASLLTVALVAARAVNILS